MSLILLIIIFLSFPKFVYATSIIPIRIACSSQAKVLLYSFPCNCTENTTLLGVKYYTDCKCSYGSGAMSYIVPCDAAPNLLGGQVHCESMTAYYPGGKYNNCSAVSEPVYTEQYGCQRFNSSVSCGYGCTTVPGTDGVCGEANGKTYDIYPTSNLCSTSGSAVAIDSAGTDGVFNWDCPGTTGSCGGGTGDPAHCLAYKDNLPTLSSLDLKTYDGDTVVAETGDRNQICQPIFKQDTVNPNGVQFIITGSDTQGTSDIGDVQIRLRNTSNTYTFTEVASTDGVATIPVDLSASGVVNGTYNIEVLINDISTGVTASWIDTGRDLKYWDCEVSVSGGFYDGTNGEVCPNFSSNLAQGVNFTSLSFVSPSDGLSSLMTVNDNSTYTSSEPLIWGTTGYQAIFNTGLAATNRSLKLIDVGVGTTSVSCSSTLNFDLNSNVVDPYSDNPQLQADFSGIISQEAWFQTVNGGVLSKSTITNYVPPTCRLSTDCTEATAVGGLVAAPTINGFDNIPYSSPDNWYMKSNLVNKINYFEKYKKITGIGTTLIEGDLNDSNIINNTDGLLMINGNVTISQNKTVPVGNFSMIVASGDINIDAGVTQFDGILVGNNINIGGTSADQLVINGSLYGTNLVNITRSYTDKLDNNESPAVVINFRPDFIFNMPSSMAKSVIDWKWGN